MKYFDHSVTQPGLVAQSVERRFSNQEVVGPNTAGVKDFSFKACGRGEILEGSIAHFLALMHTLYIIILLSS